MAVGVEFRPWRAFNPEVAASFVGSMRKRRWERLIERFPNLGSMTVLDLGGTPHSSCRRARGASAACDPQY